MANKTYSKKNQEKLKVFLEKNKNNDTESTGQSHSKLGTGTQTDQDNPSRKSSGHPCKK